MHAIKRTAMSGRSIVCTIHQPSAAIFGHFSHLLLLAEGRQVYFGPIGSGPEDFSDVLRYFADADEVCPDDANPAGCGCLLSFFLNLAAGRRGGEEGGGGGGVKRQKN
jgi:ABC-type multidrug transport system ATPase subunit